MASVTFEGIRKVYGSEVLALEDFDLTVRDGEFLVLVGPSGCGKSTILRLLAGLEEPTEGKMLIDGRDVTETSPQERDIAMVFQNYALYPHMTVYDNMAFSLKMRKAPKDDIGEYVREAAEILDMEGYLERRPKELSGGQRQRVAVGRAIVRHPQVFLFDEPLSNLDAKLRVQMRSELIRLHNRLGATMIYVTHDQAEAMTMGDRIVVLREGRIQQVAIPSELYEKPCNRFVAGFIGSPAMNLLDVALRGSEIVLSTGDRLPSRWTAREGEGYTFGVRPEDLNLRSDGSLTGGIEVVETLGNEKIVYLSVGDEQLVMRCGPTTETKLGEKVRFDVDIARAHLFDPDGRRVAV
ncbi:sn-glycerol-3-phosphate ABC transporter ATP-binding protein UgpC [Candidatus Fermentibacteria bacterium]|nr:sn-glycerol-3-phosphate ABC transporter ATP-binding protein UgpC [Candidatus Fermentibacteria bacterium]